MTTYNTSRVFEAVRKCKERLEAQTWPTHPAAGTSVRVALCEPNWDGAFEVVWIVPQVEEDASIEWRSMPNGRDESFDLSIRVSTADLLSEDAVLGRLEVLADVVQRAFYDDNTPATPPNERMKPLDIAEAVKLEGVGQVSFAIYPADDGGFRAVAEIRYRLAFRI